jgi:DNA-binding beta-propeller fold protein YncE
MSKITFNPNASGTGTFSIASPDSNTNRTLTLPDSTGELLTTTGDGSGLTGIVIPPIFNPVAVSGTTPSLDVGSYNFFKQGDLTANTTVSFTSVPTNARWSYSYVSAAASDAWDISTASFNRFFSTAVSGPEGIFFKPDGTRLYVAEENNIAEYHLSKAWDVATASYLHKFGTFQPEIDPKGVFLKPDGTKMFIAGNGTDSIHEYDLSTAWDVSTASLSQSLSIGSQDVTPEDIFFKPDGAKVYIVGSENDSVFEYNLSTAWDVSTASYLQSFSVTSQDTYPKGVFFKPDGTKMYIMGDTGNDVNEYDLSTAWDVTTASYLQNFSVTSQDTDTEAVFFKPNGTKMYVAGIQSYKIYEYNVGTQATLTLPASVENPYPIVHDDGSQVTYEFITMDGGTTVTLIGKEVI